MTDAPPIDCDAPTGRRRPTESAGSPPAAGATGSGDVQPRSSSADLSRRAVLAATGAGLAGAGLSSTVGSASDHVQAPLFARDGNRIVGPEGQPVTLRGVNVADPGEQSRDWRGMDAPEVVDLATMHEDWSNAVVRVPIHPEFAATGSAAASGPSAADLPHGDEWGPVLPGTFDASTLESYLEAVVDPLVQRAVSGAYYLVLSYGRHRPVHYHDRQADYVENGVHEDYGYDDYASLWDCDADADVDHTVLEEQTTDFSTLPDGASTTPGVCGERGVLWHGADQKEAVRDLAEEQQLPVYSQFVDSIDDLYLEPDPVCHALDREVETFWAVVADRYGDVNNVLFDVYGSPGGPYAGGWASPTEHEALTSLPPDVETHRYEPWGEYNEPYYDLWVERSQPWVDAVQDHSQGQLTIVGSPQFCQTTYWAPYNEHDGENVCYAGQVYTQESLRPLEGVFGCPSSRVPLFLTEFGWQDYTLYYPRPWLDGHADEWATGETDVTGGMSFAEFFEAFHVHPIASTFDHSRVPIFFERGPADAESAGALGSDNWYEDGYLIGDGSTPGEWWRQFVNERSNADVAPGPDAYLEADDGPNPLDGAERGSGVGYALPPGEEPPTSCAPTGDGTPTCLVEGGADATTVDGETVCDVDGDGLYRDVTADGRVGHADVQAFFEVQHRPAWKQPDVFDFNGNDVVGPADVVTLFTRVATRGL